MNPSSSRLRSIRFGATAILLQVPFWLALPSVAAGWRGSNWPTGTPESQGLSSARLDAIKDRLAEKKTRAFLVVRHDKLVYEWYAPGTAAATRQGSASLAKALVAGLSLAVVITDGKVSLDDHATKFVPQWKSDPRKSEITIRHLGSHTSGLGDSTTENVVHEEQPGWRGEFWKRLDSPRDPFTLARDETPMLFEPGERLSYSNPGIGMLTYCVTAAIRNGAHRDIRTLLRARVMRPIGAAEADWSIGYSKTFVVDRMPLVGSWGGGAFTPRITARLGRLVLHEGAWNGRQLLSKAAVHQVTGDAGLNGHCGMGWWSNGGQRYPKLPADAVWGAGAGDQLLLVIPSLDLVMVRYGETLTPGPNEAPVRTNDVFTRYHDYRTRILFEPLVEAVTDAGAKTNLQTKANAPAPVITFVKPPRSEHIRELRWAPVETIRRAAPGSDNWPLAWADDDQLYGAYGDGYGFAPLRREKLSLGLAKISGGPADFLGANILSPSCESRGDGPHGRKASGLLSVGGTLYLWTRNVTNAQLGWSADRGETWTWADWRFSESFGCPTFLDDGKDGAPKRGEFAYIYSPDKDSAYETAAALVLARAPRGRLHDRAAYEFFSGLDEAGRAQWSREVRARRSVCPDARGFYRCRVTYHPGLRRYLLVQPVPTPPSRDASGRIDTRSHGGLAVYDAPEPWGPWTTVHFADHWDVGPGDSAGFPSKWIKVDGATLHLVFSGDDAFSVRQATLVRAP
jgi:CubicO group peptidase (beta-lactamase class C family)